jgi:hypothetical protein
MKDSSLRIAVGWARFWAHPKLGGNFGFIKVIYIEQVKRIVSTHQLQAFGF